MKLTSNAAQVAARVRAWAQDIGPEAARATLEAATVLTAAAKRESPVRTGRLRRSVSYVAGGQARYVVAPHVPYAAAVHGGARPHVIRPRVKKALSWKGALHPVRLVNHPGNAPNPFMQRALETSGPQLAAISARLGQRIITRRG